jgi:N-acetylglucosaminyl-diphospho-decaprenol L-rhamnosyltransferase
VTESTTQTIVSAIVVTHNSEQRIISCLKALKDEISIVGGEILVFDNNSIDSTVSSIKSEFPEVKLTGASRNLGFAAACNAAAATARGKYLLFANPDIIIDGGALSTLIGAIETLPRAGATVGRMRHPDGSFQPTCRQLPDFNNLLFSRGSVLPAGLRSSSSRRGYTFGDSDEIIDVPAASATCLLVEKEFFHSIGGFDPRFFLFMEDTDLSLRIRQAGKKIYFVPRAGAVHFWGQGAAISKARRSWYHHVSVWKYFLKHYPTGASIFILPVVLLINFILSLIIGRKIK